ncbi:MAG: hydrogenase [Planctomycetaceae bacterium]|nr:hydrogenase [Planctomycetaceae bacterium]
MNVALLIFHLTVMLVAPIFMVGIINRVKSIWAGRRGPRLVQSWYDIARLLRKTPVYSQATSWIFPYAPYFVLATTITAGLIAPVVPGFAILAFPGDLIAFAYLLAFGRVPLMLSALDTASAFEGMGASREATYSALLEPVLLLSLGTLGCLNNVMSFQDIVSAGTRTEFDVTVLAAIVFALFVLLVIESSRVPADDPTTHLELTMVHEVMVLDHSGPELGVIQYTAAMKMTVFAMVIAAVVNPFSVAEGGVIAMLSMATSLVLLGVVAIVVGLLESLTARLRFRALPLFILAAFIAVVIALVAVVARQGGLR